MLDAPERAANADVQANGVARAISAEVRRSYGRWNEVLVHALTAGQSGHLSSHERTEKLRLIAGIEAELDASLLRLDEQLAAVDPAIALHSRITDIRRAADRMRDLMVRCRVALRGPDYLEP